MTDKQTLAERRLALLKLMSSPAQPSVTDAWNILKSQYSCSLGALSEDWDRRFQWLPTVWRLDDPTVPAMSLEALRDIGKRAYAIYGRSEAVGDHLTALSALRTAFLAHSAILRFYHSCGKITVTQTNVTMNQTVITQETAKPSEILRRYQESLEEAVREMNQNPTSQQNNPQNQNQLSRLGGDKK